MRLDEAVKASSGTTPVITPNDFGAVSETNKKQIDYTVRDISIIYVMQLL